MANPVDYSVGDAADGTIKMDDRELVERLLAGDEAAYAIFWETYYTRIVRFTLRIVRGDHDAAEDIAQDVFEHCLLKLDQFEFRSKLSSWMMRIAYFKALKALKDGARKVASNVIGTDEVEIDLMDRMASPAPNPHHEAASREAMERYRAALSKLDSEEIAIWTMRKEEGIPYEEMAVILEKSANSLRITVHRIKGCLLEALAEV